MIFSFLIFTHDNLITSQSNLIAFFSVFLDSLKEQQLLQRERVRRNSICLHITRKVIVIWQGICVSVCVENIRKAAESWRLSVRLSLLSSMRASLGVCV